MTWKDKEPAEMTIEDVTTYLDSLDGAAMANINVMSSFGEDKLKVLLGKAKEAKNKEGERFTFVALVLAKARAGRKPAPKVSGDNRRATR